MTTASTEPAPTELSPFRTVIRSRHALYLLGTSLVGRLPTAMAAIAIVQLVRLQGGDFALAGIMTAAYVVAGAIGQPALGRLADHAGQTTVLLVAGVVGTGSFVGMALLTAPAPVLAVIFAALAGLFTPPLEPSLRSLWPTMVPGGAPLKAAFSLDAGAQELVFIAGPLLTVLGISAFGATGNIFFAAALGLVGTLAFAANSLSRSHRISAHDVAGRVNPVADARFRRVVAFLFGVGVPIGILTITVTAYGEQEDLPSFAGWALSANAVGALIGATWSATHPTRRAPQRLLALCGLLLGVGYLPLAASGLPVWALIAFAVLAGLMLPFTLTQVFDYVHSTTTPGSLTEANAWAVSALNVGIAAGTTGAGAAVSAWGTGAIPAVVVAGSVLTLLLALLVLPRTMMR